MQVFAGGSDEGTPITIVLSEDGFTLPANGSALKDVGQTTMIGLSSASTSTTGVLTDATLTSVSTPTGVLTATGQVTESKSLGAYLTPLTLESLTTLSGTSLSFVPGSIGFTQTVSVSVDPAVPEPASLVMILTGVPLVVLGLIRRRAAS
jgi:hypothetical protein